MLVLGLVVRETDLEYRGHTVGGADREHQRAVTVSGIPVRAQSPLIDEQSHRHF